MQDVFVPLIEQFVEYLDLGDTGSALLSKVLATEKTEQYLESLERAGISPIFTSKAAEAQLSPGINSVDFGASDKGVDESLKSLFGRLQLGDTQALDHQEPIESMFERLQVNETRVLDGHRPSLEQTRPVL